jgi:hypothetical protein
VGGSLRDFAALLRLHEAISRAAQSVGAKSGWDVPVSFLSPTVVQEIDAVGKLIDVQVPLPKLPSAPSTVDFRFIVYVDACKQSWGAYVVDTSLEHCVYELWERIDAVHGSFSAHAEPWGARRVLQRMAKHLGMEPKDSVAVVSDHRALPLAQRRWQTGFGGCSTAWFVNSFFKELYHGGRESVVGRREVFALPGDVMPADELSRRSMPGIFSCRRMRKEELGALSLWSLHAPPVVHPYENSKVADAGVEIPREQWMI